MDFSVISSERLC